MVKAYLLINISDEGKQMNENELLQDLHKVSGITKVEPVLGRYDLLVEIRTNLPMDRVINKVMEKGWLRRMHVLRQQTHCPYCQYIDENIFCEAGQLTIPLSNGDVRSFAPCLYGNYRKCLLYHDRNNWKKHRKPDDTDESKADKVEVGIK